jgi:hypothetical protein
LAPGLSGPGDDRCRGVAKLVKASDFDSDIRGFESFLPCHHNPEPLDEPCGGHPEVLQF